METEICLLVTEKIIKYRSYAAGPRTGLAMERRAGPVEQLKLHQATWHTLSATSTYTHTQSVSQSQNMSRV